MREMRSGSQIWSDSLKESDHVAEIGLASRIILKWILMK
jgi:hypothetical protein